MWFRSALTNKTLAIHRVIEKQGINNTKALNSKCLNFQVMTKNACTQILQQQKA